MRKYLFKSFLVVLVLSAVVLGGCGDSDEVKSKQLLGQAETLIQEGKEEQAEKALSDLMTKYPGTQSSTVANKHLETIKKQRALREQQEQREREKFAKVLGSYQLVFNGYHSLYAEYPKSVEALDQSEYFFDSNYFEEITPEGYQVYLFLQTDGAGYRVWCVNEEQDQGYVVNAMGQKLIPFDRAQTLEELKTSFHAEAWDKKVVALSSR